jgi:hypothetical protein
MVLRGTANRRWNIGAQVSPVSSSGEGTSGIVAICTS